MDFAMRELLARIGEHERFGLHDRQRERLMQIMHNLTELYGVEAELRDRPGEPPNLEPYRQRLLGVVRNAQNLWRMPPTDRSAAGRFLRRVVPWAGVGLRSYAEALEYVRQLRQFLPTLSRPFHPPSVLQEEGIPREAIGRLFPRTQPEGGRRDVMRSLEALARYRDEVIAAARSRGQPRTADYLTQVRHFRGAVFATEALLEFLQARALGRKSRLWDESTRPEIERLRSLVEKTWNR